MKSYYILTLSVATLFLSCANAETRQNSDLPPSKAYLQQCRRQALAAHPGVIAEFTVQHEQQAFLARYRIAGSDGADWFVSCDLANGNRVREQALR